MKTEVEVTSPASSEISLIWPVDLCSEETTYPDGIPGYTDSGQPVLYSQNGGSTWQSVSPDPATGLFFISASQSPGNQSLMLKTDNQAFPEKSISAPYFINSLDITSPAQDYRFNTQSGGSANVTFTSETTDTVDMYVVDPCVLNPCANGGVPIPAADMLNGAVYEGTRRIINAVGSHIAVSAGSNTITWDGKNNQGQYVSPGIYDVIVRRANTDGLLETDDRVRMIVEKGDVKPQVIQPTATVNGPSVKITWRTDVPTTGYVVWENDGFILGKIKSIQQNSMDHTVWLPGTEPGITYGYYIIAVNESNGSTSVTERKSVTTGGSTAINNVWAAVETTTSAKISWNTVNIVTGGGSSTTSRVEYARVGPSVSTLQWLSVQNLSLTNEHLVTISNLQANTEYVYRVVSATDGSWTNPTKSAFYWFTTKKSPSSVEITNLQDGATVSSISDITVRAQDTIHRFSRNGITGVRLFVDGMEVTDYSRSLGWDYAEYTFHAGSFNLGDGLHKVEAVAYDDYWQITRKRIYIVLDSSTQMMLTQSTTSSGSLVRRKAVARTMVSLKKAKKKLEDVLGAGGMDAEQEKLCRAMVSWFQYWISKKFDLATSNLPGMNAIAWMMMNYGDYKSGKGIPENKDIRRKGVTQKHSHCNIAVSDAFLLGNEHLGLSGCM